MRLFPVVAVFGSLMLGFAGPAYAKPVPQEELARVNAYLMSLATASGGNTEGFSGGFTVAEEDEQGLISRLEVAVEKKAYNRETGEIGAHEGGLKLSLTMNEDVEVGASGDVSYHLDLTFLAPTLEHLRTVHAALKKAGLYELESDVGLEDGTKLSIDATLTPKSPAAEAIKHAHLALQSDLATDVNAASGVAVLSTKGELVARGRSSMTKVFNALRAAQEPVAQDMEELSNVYVELVGNLVKALEAADDVPVSHDEL